MFDGYFVALTAGSLPLDGDGGRDVHSSTFRPNVSSFCVICRVHEFPPVY